MKNDEITIQEIQKIQKRLFLAGETLRVSIDTNFGMWPWWRSTAAQDKQKEVWAVLLNTVDELAEVIRKIKFGGDDAEAEKETGEVG